MTPTKINIGQRVHCILYGGNDGTVYNIDGIQRPDTVRTSGGFVQSGGNAYFDIVWDDGTTSKRTPESILHCGQWRIYDELLSPEQIITALEYAQAETARKEEEAKQAAIQREEARKQLKTEYSHLIQSPGSGGKGAAKNIRIELKKAWPKIKFSVRSDYSSININWLDGPTERQVETIVNRYEAGSFDGMEDIYRYSESAFNDVFGSVQYVFTRRENSDGELLRAFDVLKKRYGGNMTDIKSIDLAEYRKGNLRHVPMNFGGGSRDDLQSAVSGVVNRLPQAGYEFKSKATKTEEGYNLHYFDLNYGRWNDREYRTLEECHQGAADCFWSGF